LGGEAVVLFAPAVAVTGEGAVVRGVAVVLLAAARGADDGGLRVRSSYPGSLHP